MDERARPATKRRFEQTIGAYPGTFDPPTVAHLGIARIALSHHRLDRLDLLVSTAPLGKLDRIRPTLDDRVDVLRAACADIDGVDVVVSDLQLIAELVAGYDLVVMGADKWHQINDPSWYGSTQARDQALRQIPPVTIVPRRGHDVPDVPRLPVPDELLDVSSTRARTDRPEWMTESARRFDRRTGAWSDPDRYDRWIADRP